MERDTNQINFEYAQAAARAGEHLFKAKALKEEADKHEYQVEKLFNQMESLNKEAIKLAQQQTTTVATTAETTTEAVTEVTSETV